MPTPEELIELLGLEPLPYEGGLFTQSYKSPERIPQEALPERYTTSKSFGTAIYYLLTAEADSFSALHRLPTDEIYHFYLGDPVELLLLFPGGGSQRVVLGQDLLGGQQVQFLAPKEVWQGSRVIDGGAYALLGTTMAPGYEDEDFLLGEREALLAEYPDQAALIKKLTR